MCLHHSPCVQDKPIYHKTIDTYLLSALNFPSRALEKLSPGDLCGAQTLVKADIYHPNKPCNAPHPSQKELVSLVSEKLEEHSYPNFEKPFVLQCDASDNAVGVIPAQISNGKEHVIS